MIVLVSLKKTTATITQKIVGSYLTPLFRSRVRFKIICQESSDIVDSSLQRSNIQSGTDIICTRWFHSSSGTSPQNACLSNSQLVRYLLSTYQMSSFTLIPLKVFLTLKQAALCNNVPQGILPINIVIQIRRLPLQLPPLVSSFSSYTQSQTFHLITKKLTIQIQQIARSRHRNLKKTCEHGQGRFQILARGALSSWSGAFWRAFRKAAF